MATVPAPGDTPAKGFIGTLAVVALTLLLAYQLAHWTWVFIAPAPVASVPDGEAPVNLPAIARLFGGEIPAASEASSSSGVRLKGVIAPPAGVAGSAGFFPGRGQG